MKKIKRLAPYPIFIFIIFNSSLSYSCTTFILQQGKYLLFGRNFDWCTGTGLLIVNQRNLEKTALIEPPEKPVKWISKYGSITFNQVGRELPYGGINESGLVVEHASLDLSLYNFVTAANMVKNADHKTKDSLVDHAFAILSRVSQGYGTNWSIVYDITNMKIYFLKYLKHRKSPQSKRYFSRLPVLPK